VLSTALGQITGPDGYHVGDDPHSGVLVQYDWEFDRDDIDKATDMIRKWMDSFQRQDTVYYTGTLMHTWGYAKRNRVIRQELLFTDLWSAQYFVNKTRDLDVYGQFEELKPNLQLSGVVKGYYFDNAHNWDTETNYTENKWFSDVYPGLRFEFAYVSIHNYGPYRRGQLNYPDESFSDNGLIIINYSYRSKDIDVTEDFMKGLFNHLESSGIFGNGVSRWDFKSNLYGITGTIICDSPEGLSAYLDQVFEWVPQHNGHWSFVQTYGQNIGFERDMADPKFYDLFDYFNSTYMGLANPSIYDGSEK